MGRKPTQSGAPTRILGWRRRTWTDESARRYRIPARYDVTMTESTVGSSGHYVGDFDASGNIVAGTYRICIYKQAGANPADTDLPIGQAEIYWNGTKEIELGVINGNQVLVHNVYREVPDKRVPQVTVK